MLQSGGKGLQTRRRNKSRFQASVYQNEEAPATHCSTSRRACVLLAEEPAPLQPSEEDLAGGGRPDNLDGLCEVDPHPASSVNSLSSRNIPTFTLHFGPPLSSQKPPRALVCPCLDRSSRGPSVVQTPALRSFRENDPLQNSPESRSSAQEALLFPSLPSAPNTKFAQKHLGSISRTEEGY